MRSVLLREPKIANPDLPQSFHDRFRILALLVAGIAQFSKKEAGVLFAKVPICKF